MTGHPDAYTLLDSMNGLEVPAGTNLLVTASAPAGREFLFRLLGQGLRDGESLLVITTEKAAGSITEQVQDVTGGTTADLSEHLRIIDCQTDELDVSDEALVTQNVDTPRNLTDIGIGFKNAFEEFEAQGADRVRFGLLSLSVVLSYVDRETGYRFCQTLTRGLGQEDALGLFLLNVEAHDERTVNTLRRAFDGTLEVSSERGELNARLSGLDGISDEWIPVEK
jgi:KaiC/GvpD/RAD55 family RecA-like ATPase